MPLDVICSLLEKIWVSFLVCETFPHPNALFTFMMFMAIAGERSMLTQNVSESSDLTCCLGENRPEVPDRGSLGSARPLPWAQTLCTHRCFPLTRLARVYPPPHRQSRHGHTPALSLLPSRHEAPRRPREDWLSYGCFRSRILLSSRPDLVRVLANVWTVEDGMKQFVILWIRTFWLSSICLPWHLPWAPGGWPLPWLSVTLGNTGWRLWGKRERGVSPAPAT